MEEKMEIARLGGGYLESWEIRFTGKEGIRNGK